MIDSEKVKAFWDQRASSYQKDAFESIANLEHNPENLALKIELESRKVADYIGPVKGMSILDFGAGVGQWAFRFVEAGATTVTAVEYSSPLVEIGRAEAARRGIKNLSFQLSPAEKFADGKTYDLVFISGLLVYMNDDQVELFLQNMSAFCRTETIVILRDGTGRGGLRHEINNQMSQHLQSRYSAIYRPREEYLRLFARYGFTCIRDENMFEEGSPLNKYPETRLRIYRFSLLPLDN